jgi:glycosyltransferase involved in cell wall biosynthesis
VLKILPNTKFWVVGSDTGVSRMISLSKELGVHSNFCFLGWIPHEDLVNLYSQTDIFVMPSLTEAFGVTFLEAMACGVPVIGTRVGGIPEIIQHGYNGLLVEPNNSDDLADAIIQLLSDSELRKQLRIAGVETAHRFDVSRMMECTYSIYKRIIGSW